jgi:hypothetical protein
MRTTGINTIKNIKAAKKEKHIRRFILIPPLEVIEPPLAVEKALKLVLSFDAIIGADGYQYFLPLL